MSNIEKKINGNFTSDLSLLEVGWQACLVSVFSAGNSDHIIKGGTRQNVCNGKIMPAAKLLK